MDITIEALEAYLAERYRGWATEQGLFMKLVEEMGEIAEVLNQRSGAKAVHAGDLDQELGRELADVIHYAVAIAAVTGLDLNAIMLEKDRTASAKYGHDIDLERFLPRRERIERVRRMEDIFDRFRENRAPALEQELLHYYRSGAWRCDYEADERGELPGDLKRGVLSQDGLWNLLEE